MSTYPLLPQVSLVPGRRSFYYSNTPGEVESFFIAMSVKTFLVDLRVEAMKGKLPMVSDFLVHSMKQELAKGNMCLLMLNRRGHARTLLCTSCGTAHQCTHCAVSMTIHKQAERYVLLCHYCGKKEALPSRCSHCDKTSFSQTGFGVQQVEEEMRLLFPDKNILRMDADTTRGKHAFTEVHDQLVAGKVDILLGTQMLAKGLDNPRITLVGVVDADIGLSIPDFRAEERTFQLLMQVLGRAGRAGDQSTVIIQSWMPESPSISCAASGDREGFYAYLLEQRRTYLYPPFTSLIKASVMAKTPEEAQKHADMLAEEFRRVAVTVAADTEVMTAPAFIPRQHGVYVHHIILKGTKTREVLEHTPLPSSLRVDVEPLQLL